MSEAPAKLLWNGKEIELPVVRGTENEYAIDISKLRAQTGLITLDYGYVNTGSTESAITFIDGDLGILRYRGYDIEAPRRAGASLVPRDRVARDLRRAADRGGARRVQPPDPPAHARARGREALLLRLPQGRAPDGHHRVGGQRARDLLPGLRRPARSRAGAALDRATDGEAPTVAAYSYKQSIGQPFLYPDNSLDLIENFLRMMFAVPSEPYEVSPTIVHALKQLLILHADHEQNCSTSTVRMVGSAEANLYASIAAGVDALWGPLHGGANQACVEMLEDIRDHGGDVARRCAGPRTRTTRSGSPASATASTRTTTPAPRS